MKTKNQILLTALLLSTINFPQSTARAQGNLTPPGAPAPTMKTLDQVQPRTPISALPFNASSEGSYYLTASLTASPSGGGISVTTNNVTIDLNGFELIGNGGTHEGIILFGGVANVTIRNGTIRNWGGYAINGAGNSAVRVEKVVARNNSGTGGIYLDQKASVIDCLADGNVGVGIFVGNGSTIVNSQATGTTGSPGTGIIASNYCTLNGCIASGNSGNGIVAGKGGSLDHCAAASNGSVGIQADSGCALTACTASGNSSIGISAYTGCNLHHCTATFNGSYGIFGTSTLVSECSANNNTNNGINVNGGLVSGCAAQGNTLDGIYISPGIVSGCYVQGNTRSGIFVNAPGSSVLGNTSIGDNTSANANNASIFVNDSHSRIEGNHVTTSGPWAFNVGSTYKDNIFIKNSAQVSDLTVNTYQTTNQIYGPFIHSTISNSTLITEQNPWANFSTFY